MRKYAPVLTLTALALGLAMGRLAIAEGPSPSRTPLALSPSPETGERRSYPFTAYPVGGGAAVYRGAYDVLRDGARVEEHHRYRTLAGARVLDVASVFDLDRMRPISYHSRSYRTGEVIDARLEDGTLRFRIRDGDGRTVEQGAGTWKGGTYLWPNLVHVVRRNWQPINDGAGVELALFIIQRNAPYGFELRKVRGQAGEDPRTARMELVPSSWLLRALVTAPTFVFSTEQPGLLLEYEGRSAVTDEQGHPEDLRIVLDVNPTG